MSDEAVQVTVRIRPFLPRERGQRQIVNVLTTQLTGPPQEEDKVFSFDHCLSSVKPNDSRRDEPHAPPVTQEQVYEVIGQNLLENALEGFNSCLFAYGQTGSGKTYTVLGHERDPGIIPRLCLSLFSQEYDELRVSASFLEIYNEQLKDLLNPQMEGRKPLYVHQHPQLGVYVPHLTEAPVGSHSECMGLLDFGSKIRATSQTNMNSTSSRSHALFILRITFPIKDEARTRIRNSTLNLIDLAGSERVKKSGAAGQRMREGQNINSSLSVLGQVISKLAQGKFKHVPFRQSKLTYLLTDALNGNSKTHMVAAISPALSEMEETLGTLRFASSVKKVRTHAVSNEQDVGESDLLLQTMRSEAEELKAAAIKAREESPQQARRLEIHAEAVEHAVISMQTRIDKTMWSQAQQAQQEATRQALAGLSLPFAIGGMLGGQSQDGVTANSPYLLNISDDISLAGRLLYFLPEGPPISVGSGENNRIRLMGLGIPDRLCDISVVAGGKGVEVQHSGGGRLMVDGIQVSENQAAALYNGARIIFGRSLAFRLVIPLASQSGGRGLEDEEDWMNPRIAPPQSPFPACDGDALQRLRLLVETSVMPVLGETECAEIMRRAGEVHNDVDEANELLKEIESPPLQVLEVGLLLRAPPERPSSTSDSTPASRNNRRPQLVVHCSRMEDGELLCVWPIPRFYQHLEELRDHYQQRCDQKRLGLPLDAHRGVSMAWEDAVSSPTRLAEPQRQSDNGDASSDESDAD